jgi:hypothetical protein
MKELFIAKKFSKESLMVIIQAEKIINEYVSQGYTLTLRQLYYQFVARNLIPNSQKSYNRIGSVINNARLAGEISWEAIEDRTRNLERLSTWKSPAEIMHAVKNQYRIDKWKNQPNRIEVWIEKEALVGVIERICNAHQVPYFACRGYTSQSEQWSAGKRFEGYRGAGQDVVVLHLGDHDPSGIDMTRDNEDRLWMLSRGPVKVERLALNFDQIAKYSPPPNPAKMTDSRFNAYMDKYGSESWELDALNPSIISQLIEDAILSYKDEDLWREDWEKEDKQKGRLCDIAMELEDEYEDES